MQITRQNFVVLILFSLGFFINSESKCSDFTTIKSEIREAIRLESNVILISPNKKIAEIDLSDKNNSIEVREDVIIISVIDEEGSGEKYYLPYTKIIYLSWSIKPFIKYEGKLMSHSEAISIMEMNDRPVEEIQNIQKLKGVPHRHELLIKF